MQTIEITIDVPDLITKYTGTKTERNLWTAFIGESMARNRYTYYSSLAKKAGYEQIAEFFLRTACNEKEHAKIWFKQLGQAGDLSHNLLTAATGEKFEWAHMYRKMVEDAKAEGFYDLAKLFEGVADVERIHEERLRDLLHLVNAEEVFTKSGIVFWECRNCGHICADTVAPEECPVCNHPKAFFQVTGN